MGQLNMDHYLTRLRIRYFQNGRKVKSQILDEFCATAGIHRKHAIRILTRKAIGVRKVGGRHKTYDPSQLIGPLKRIWLATDQMCGKRLKAAIPLWLPYYAQAYEPLAEEIKHQLLTVSAATLDRLLLPLRSQWPKRLSGTKPGSILRQQIPIKTDQWDEKHPGFMECDTVAHCGTSLLGSFIWSITLTDIFSGWTENRATWNKGAEGVVNQLRSIEDILPFLIFGFDSDNGSEFMNYHLIRYFQERKEPVQFTRSRPYHKGDNAHVEQKNWTHVRQLFGYYRLEDPQLVPLMNDLYQNEWSLLHNYFCPSMKLQDKIRVQSRIKKKHKLPETPYQRLMTCEHIDALQKEKLKKTFESLNPFKLRLAIEHKLKRIFSYVELNLKKTGTG